MSSKTPWRSCLRGVLLAVCAAWGAGLFDEAPANQCPTICDDHNPCTDDSCNHSTGQCVFRIDNTNACTDNNACTSDACVNGVCVSTPLYSCDDGNPCTDDACTPSTGACTHTNDDANGCSDGIECTSDRCVAGVCVGTPGACDDGNPCTDDACNVAAGRCVFTNDDGNACSDGNACTTDACVAGRCVGTPAVACDDHNPCTDDACDPASGQCTFTPNDTHACAATGGPCATPACSAGACVCTVPLSLWTSSTYPYGLDLGVNMGVSWGDYDADGRIDLFNAYSGILWRNVGGSGWEFPHDLSALVPPTERRYGSSFGDYDNDGLPDIAVAPRVPAWGDDRFHLLHNLGGGPNFIDIASDPTLVDVQPYGNAETLCWADVDGDGYLDLFVPVYPGTLGPGNFFLYNRGPIGPGDNAFSERSGPAGLNNPADTSRPEGAQFADVDGDGDVDLFSNGTLYQNVSTPHVPSFIPLSEAASGIGLRGSLDEGAMLFDYDLDGDFDLVVAYVNEGVRIWENRGDGTFIPASPSVIDAPLTGLNLGMSAEDWDNDGDIDLVTRDVFRRNMLVEDGTRHFTVEHAAIPEADISSALPAWGDWDGDGDLDCAMGNWGDDGHLYENRLYTAATPLGDRRYVRVRAVRDAPNAPRGLEVEYGAVAEIRLLNVPDPFRRKKFVASSHGYLNQNEYTLQFGLPPRPPSGDLRFDLSVDFPGTPGNGLLRIDKHVNPALGNIDLGLLQNREITVDRSGRAVLNGVAYDPIPGAAARLTTSGGGLALPGANPLPEPTPAPGADWHAGLVFDTQGSSTSLAVREIVIDGQLAAPDTCGSGTYNLALWDMTGASPVLVSGGTLSAVSPDHNRRTFVTTDIVLAPGRVYRLAAHVTTFRTSPLQSASSAAGLTVRGGIAYAGSSCAADPMIAAPVDPTAVGLAIRFVPVATGSCSGRPAGFCDDGNGCTDDACGPSGTCVHTPNTKACDDGNSCTLADRCNGGTCSGVVTTCDDGNPCTTDLCDPLRGCTHTNNADACDDGDPCTTVDVCVSGSCRGSGSLTCNDANDCTDDACVPGVGCVFSVDDANACSDKNMCTAGDHCVAGRCVGTTIGCDDGVVCTTDACLPSTGCTHTRFEVEDVRFSSKTFMVWSSRSSNARYAVARGDGARLPTLGSGASESCLADGKNSNSVAVSDTPVPGSFFWYLVRASSSNCGVGTYGFDYDALAPATERALSICP